VTPCDRFRFWIYLTRDKPAVIRQPFGHHERAVAGERSDLEDGAGSGEPDEHLEKTSFDDIDLHLGPVHDSIGFFAKTDMQLALRFGVIAGELLDRGIDKVVHAPYCSSLTFSIQSTTLPSSAS
jgi:hypothetical protein